MAMGDATGDVTWRTRGWLPHAERAGGIYFVTFRLAGSLSAEFLRNTRQERDHLERRLRDRGRPLRPDVERKLDLVERRRIENALDVGRGQCWLRTPAAARIVVEALAYFDGERYALGPWCVMPNHVHVLVRPFAPSGLARTLHTWKSFTASQANQLLSRSGALWHREYFDRLIRNERELRRCRDYVVSNPGRAGLHNWPWVGQGDMARLTGRE